MDNAKEFLYTALYCMLFAVSIGLLMSHMRVGLGTVSAIKNIICDGSNMTNTNNATIEDASVLSKADIIAMIIAGPTTDFSIDGIYYSYVKFDVNKFPFNSVRSKYYKKTIEYDADGNIFVVKYNTV